MITAHNGVDHASHQNGATLIDRREPRIWIRTDDKLTVMTISGEIDASDIDASDIDDLGPHARQLVRDCGVLIVDLSRTDFIAVGGLRALFALWSMDPPTTEPSRARVMRICSQHLTVELRRRG